MTPVKREILIALERSKEVKVGGMWLNPAAIAKNIDRSRPNVSTRLKELVDEGYIETDGAGYYRITNEGSEIVRDI